MKDKPLLLESLRYGDHLFTWGGVISPGITHHGIYIGNGEVIHYLGGRLETIKKPIACTSLEEFMGSSDAGLGIIHHLEPLEPKDVVERALKRVGESEYDLFLNNCEHFAFDCKLGTANSYQLMTAFMTGIGLLGAIFFRWGPGFLLIPGLINGCILERMRIEIVQNCPAIAFSYTPHYPPIERGQNGRFVQPFKITTT
jgi:hypothetical protein